uniref:Uncharacterized protein n=1 Tax=Arundo donax TaxID=35708 RepID=A0A0A9HKX3_ARUDO
MIRERIFGVSLWIGFVGLCLLNFPLDCLDEDCLARSISTFATFLEWHSTTNKARPIIHVILNSIAKVRFSIVVGVGDGPCTCCWSVACYILHEEIMALLDEDPLPPHGCTLHTPPSPPPRWLGKSHFHYPQPPARCSRDWDGEGEGSCINDHVAQQFAQGAQMNTPVLQGEARLSALVHMPVGLSRDATPITAPASIVPVEVLIEIM